MKLKNFTLLFVSFLQVGCSNLVPARLDRAAIADMQGTWYSKGYGYVFNLQREHLELYTVAGDTCFKEDYGFTELAYDFPYYQLVTGNQIQLSQTAGDKTVDFNPIPSLPIQCSKQSSDDPVSIVKAYSDILEEHYPFFELHGVDWSERSNRLIESVTPETNDEQLAQSLFSSMEGISDSHLGVLANIKGKRKGESRRRLRTLDKHLEPVYDASKSKKSYNRFRKDWIKEQRKSAVTTVLGTEKKSLAGNKLVWGKAGKLGYLQIKQFLEYSRTEIEQTEIERFASHIDTILRDLADTDALIIDVSLSRGGYGSLGFELASRFAASSAPDDGSGLLVHRHYKHNIGLSDVREEYLYPSKRVSYDKPVFVVSSDATTSAAEEFLMAMRVQNQVTLLGLPSNGSLSDVLDKTLPNGWLMVFSHEVYLSPDNELFEKVGVPVDVRVELFSGPDLQQSYQQGMVSVVELVNARMKIPE